MIETAPALQPALVHHLRRADLVRTLGAAICLAGAIMASL